MPAPLVFKSPTQPWSSAPGAQLTFQPTFIERKGPNGGRIVLDQLIVHFQGSVSVGTAALLGQDFYRFARTASVKMTDGTLRYNEVPGDCIRTYLFAEYDPNSVKEHADSAVSNNQTLTATICLPFTKPNQHEGRDYALPADLIEFVKIGCASSSEMSLGTSVVTINSGNYWLIAECHEEMDVLQHSVDEIKVADFQTTTESDLPTNGRLQGLYLMVRGASGGGSLANLTEAWISTPVLVAPQMLVTPDLQERYARARGQATNGSSATGAARSSNPFVQSTPRAAAVLLPTATKSWEQPESSLVHVKTTQSSSPGTITMVARIAKPRTQETFERTRRGFGLVGQYRMKTASNSMRNPGAWPEQLRRYMPIKFTK